MVKFLLAIILLSSNAKMIQGNSFAAVSEIYASIFQSEESKEKTEQERTKADHSDNLFCAVTLASISFVVSFNAPPGAFRLEPYSDFVEKPNNPPPNKRAVSQWLFL